MEIDSFEPQETSVRGRSVSDSHRSRTTSRRWALTQERIHEPIVDPNVPRSAVVGRGIGANFGRDSEEELL